MTLLLSHRERLQVPRGLRHAMCILVRWSSAPRRLVQKAAAKLYPYHTSTHMLLFLPRQVDPFFVPTTEEECSLLHSVVTPQHHYI